jgi:dethiobiotin synthase
MIDLLFVTGTDTDVGKSIVTAGIVRVLRRRGIDAVPMKPVQTGVRSFAESDPALACRAAGWDPPKDELDWVMPYMFEDACSPHLAAERAGHEIDLDLICDSLGRLRKSHQVVIVEGAGGLLVPLNRKSTFDNLICTYETPTLVVADNRLGMINHTLLTLAELESLELPIAGVVVNNRTPCPAGDKYIRRENVKAIQHYSDQDVPLLELSNVANVSPDALEFWTSLDAEFDRLINMTLLGDS